MHLHLGNFNILMSTKVNSEGKCRILCSDIVLCVLHNFIFESALECPSIYIFM